MVVLKKGEVTAKIVAITIGVMVLIVILFFALGKPAKQATGFLDGEKHAQEYRECLLYSQGKDLPDKDNDKAADVCDPCPQGANDDLQADRNGNQIPDICEEES